MSPTEYVPLAVAAAGVIGAVVTYIFGPSWKARIEGRARRESHGQEGWLKAVEALEAQVDAFEARADKLQARADNLEAQVNLLETQVHTLSRQVTERDERLAEQSRSLARANGRVAQLESHWPTGFTMPAPDPAHQS